MSNPMHKIQINNLYNSFVFVLITVYSFSSLTAEAGFIPHASYSIQSQRFNYNTKTNNIHAYFLDSNVKQYQIVNNECKAGQLKSGDYQGKSYSEDLPLCCYKQKITYGSRKIKNPFPYLLILTTG